MIKKKQGFTLIELIIVIAIIVALSGLLIPVFSNIQQKTIETVLENNQRFLNQTLRTEEILEGLPRITSGNATQNRNSLTQIILNSNQRFVNPKDKCNDIIGTAQAGSKACASIVIAQRNVSMDAAIASPNTNLWPLNAAASSQSKFVGVIVIQISTDGYLIYSYPSLQTVRNIYKFSFN